MKIDSGISSAAIPRFAWISRQSRAERLSKLRVLLSVPRDQFSEAGVGLVRQLENRAASVPKLIAKTQQKRVEAETTITEVDARIGDPFKHSTDLHEAQTHQARVQADLAAMADNQNPRTETADVAAPARADEQATARDRMKKLAERARTRADSDNQEERWDQGPDIRVSPPRPACSGLSGVQGLARAHCVRVSGEVGSFVVSRDVPAGTEVESTKRRSSCQDGVSRSKALITAEIELEQVLGHDQAKEIGVAPLQPRTRFLDRPIPGRI